MLGLQRMLGEDSIMDVRDGGKSIINAMIVSFATEHMLELKSQGYAGDKTDQKDSVYKGEKGEAKVHILESDLLLLADRIVNRAKRELAQFTVNITTTIKFSDGVKRRVMFVDVFFGNIPTRNTGRDQYIDVDLTWECSDYQILGT